MTCFNLATTTKPPPLLDASYLLSPKQRNINPKPLLDSRCLDVNFARRRNDELIARQAKHTMAPPVEDPHAAQQRHMEMEALKRAAGLLQQAKLPTPPLVPPPAQRGEVDNATIVLAAAPPDRKKALVRHSKTSVKGSSPASGAQLAAVTVPLLSSEQSDPSAKIVFEDEGNQKAKKVTHFRTACCAFEFFSGKCGYPANECSFVHQKEGILSWRWSVMPEVHGHFKMSRCKKQNKCIFFPCREFHDQEIKKKIVVHGKSGFEILRWNERFGCYFRIQLVRDVDATIFAKVKEWRPSVQPSAVEVKKSLLCKRVFKGQECGDQKTGKCGYAHSEAEEWAYTNIPSPDVPFRAKHCTAGRGCQDVSCIDRHHVDFKKYISLGTKTGWGCFRQSSRTGKIHLVRFFSTDDVFYLTDLPAQQN